jgi:hypothetical protein
MRKWTANILLVVSLLAAWAQSSVVSQDPGLSENPSAHLYLDKKRIVEIDDDGLIDVYFGLDSYTFAKSVVLGAKPDLEFDQILVPNSKDLCIESNSCFADSDQTIYKDTYEGASYKYYKAKTFVSISAVQKGEVTQEVLKLVADLDVRMVVSQDFQETVIGMAPSSVIWPFFNNVYQFTEKRIRFQYFNYPGSEFYAFYNTNLIKDSIYERQALTGKQYVLASTIIVTTRSTSSFWQDNACITNRRDDLMFQLTQKYYDKLMYQLCWNPSKCEFKTDLHPRYLFGTLQFSYSDYRDKMETRNLSIDLQDLVSFAPNDKIVWRFGLLPENYADGICTTTLEKGFFVKFFLTAILNFADSSVLLSLEPIDADMLFKLSPFSEFCIIVATAIATIVLCYIVYSKIFIRKIVQKVRYN